MTESSHSPAPRRFKELDGLRAVACILVVLHHTFTPSAGRFLSTYSPIAAKTLFFVTASGVECFFCLSGFILLYPYLRAGKQLELSKYSWNRLRRIYPPFIAAWLLAGLVQFVVTTSATWYSNTFAAFQLDEWLAQLNLVTLLGCNTLYNGAWWSLTVECVWYSLVPVIIWGALARRTFPASWLWMALTVVSLPVVHALASHPPTAPVEFAGISRALSSFLAFATCFTSAVWLLVYSARTSVLLGAGASGIALITYCCLFDDFRLVHPGFGLAWSAWIGLCMRIDLLRRTLSCPNLIWLGDRSYSLFLTHMSVFVFTSWAVSHWCASKTVLYGILTRLIGLPLALLIAMLIFWLVERHFSHRMETSNMFWPPLCGKAWHGFPQSGDSLTRQVRDCRGY